MYTSSSSLRFPSGRPCLLFTLLSVYSLWAGFLTWDITLPVSRLYSFLFKAIFCASVSVLLTCLKSFLMVDSQVVGCPPAFFLLNVLFASQKACLADVCSGSLMRCPNQASLRFWIVWDQGSVLHTVYSLLLVISFVLTICRRKFLWKESIFLFCAHESVHNSQLYRNTGSTKHLKLRMRDCRGLWLVHRIVLYLENVAQDKDFLLFISSEFPSNEPKNLHCSTKKELCNFPKESNQSEDLLPLCFYSLWQCF